jgi:hypothetical protein
MKQNRRKLLINQRIKSMFILFCFFSFLVAFFFLGWEIILQWMYSHYYEVWEKVDSLSNMGLILKSFLLILWVGFTFFSAYFYVESKYNGVFARMDRLFSDITNGQDKRLFFRETDSFSYVAESFNRMLANVKTSAHLHNKEKMKELVRKLEELSGMQGAPRAEIEAVVKDLKEFL